MRKLFFSVFLSITLFSVGWAETLPLETPSWVNGQVLIKLSPSSEPQVARSLSERFSSRGVKSTAIKGPEEGWFLLEGDFSTEKLMDMARSDSSISFVEPNYKVRALSVTPNDPSFSDQWGLLNDLNGIDVNATEAWSENTQGGGVVAVLDTGIDYNHIDLAGNMWVNPYPVSNDRYGYDFVNGDGDPMDDNFHGTHCAGIIGSLGNNRIGVSGVMWAGSMMAVKCLDGRGLGDVATIIQGINYILEMKQKGVPVVAVNASLSFGGYSQAAYEAIHALSKESILFVAAAGNAGSDNDLEPSYPSNYELPNVISVANITQEGVLNETSSYGLKTVHLAAPGTDILSTVNQDPYEPASGDRSLFFDDMELQGENWVVSGDWALGAYDMDPWGIGPLYRSPEKSWKLTFQPGGGQAYFTLKTPLDLSVVSNDLEVYGGAFIRGWFDGYWGYDDEWISLQCQSDPGAEWFEIARLGKHGLDHMKFTKIGGKIPRDMRRKEVWFRLVVSWSSGTIPSSSFFYLDDFGVGLAGPTERYDRKSGTSMAAPFVSGAVSLLRGMYPSESMDSLRWRILRSAKPLEGLKGKVATGGYLDLSHGMKTVPPQYISSSPIDGGRSSTTGTLRWNFRKDSSYDLEYRLYIGSIESKEMQELYRGPKSEYVLDGDLLSGRYRWQVTAVDEPGGTASRFVISGDVKEISLEGGVEEIGTPVSMDLLVKEGLDKRLFVGAPLSVDAVIPDTTAIKAGDLGETKPKKGLIPREVLGDMLGIASSDVVDQMSLSASIIGGSGDRAFFDISLSISESELNRTGLSEGIEAMNLDSLHKLGIFIFMGGKRWCLPSLPESQFGDMFKTASRVVDGEKIYDISWTVCLVDGGESSVSVYKDSYDRAFFLVRDGAKDNQLELSLALATAKDSTFQSSGGCQIGHFGVYGLILLGLPLLLSSRN
nr:S8 family serine peptidase [uncultured Dethiosulfovibrio sp.]